MESNCCGEHHQAEMTEDQLQAVVSVIEDHRSKPGSVIAVLRKCQDIVGYLPNSLIDRIAEGLNLPKSEVFGVASFYALFLFEPKGRNKVKLCMGTACYVKGINEVKNRIESQFHMKEGGNSEDMRYSLESVRCVGACSLAPVMIVNDNVHANISSDKVVEILERYE
jgi:NADH-quinone oxidoreductase subunit E